MYLARVALLQCNFQGQGTQLCWDWDAAGLTSCLKLGQHSLNVWGIYSLLLMQPQHNVQDCLRAPHFAVRSYRALNALGIGDSPCHGVRFSQARPLLKGTCGIMGCRSLELGKGCEVAERKALKAA